MCVKHTTHMHTHTHTYTHIHTHTHIHTYTHIYTHVHMVYKSYISYICIYMRTWAWCSRTLAFIYLFILYSFIWGPGRGAQEAAAPPAPRQRVGGERAVRGRPRPYELGASRCDSTEEPTQKSPPVQREIHQRKWLRATAPSISIGSVLVKVQVFVLMKYNTTLASVVLSLLVQVFVTHFKILALVFILISILALVLLTTHHAAAAQVRLGNVD